MKTLSEMYNDIQPLIDNGWNKAAVEAMEQLLSDHPDFAQGYHDLGSLYVELGEKEKAGACFQKAVDNEPQNNGFLKSLADYYHVEMENVDKALTLYKEMIENGVNNADIFFIVANLSLVKQRFKDAVEFYDKVLEIEPWHAEAFEYLEKVKAHVAAGDVEEKVLSAEELYEKAVALGAAGENDSAVRMLEKMLEMDSENAVVHNDLGVCYHRLGNEEKSLEHYQTATKIDPSNVTFQKNLADFYCFAKGQIEQALTIYLRLLKDDPEDIEVLLSAGTICKMLGKIGDAEFFYGRVIEIEPWNLDASDNLEALRESTENPSTSSVAL